VSESRGTVHLVGIGGMHMSAIAQILLADGVAVSGSDLVSSALTERLTALGAIVYEGHAASHVGDARFVVTTAAAKADNVELLEAERLGIPIIPRHEMVANLMQGRTAIAVAGTHGKTTTSSLVAFLLQRAQCDPAYLLGGESIDLGGNAAAGSGPFIVVEADEYAGAFLAYHPSLAIVTNVEMDHLDYYGSESNVLEAFRAFADNVPQDGRIVANADSPLLRRIIGRKAQPVAATINWYGIDEHADWNLEDLLLPEGGGSTFVIRSPEGRRWPATLLLPGRHNASNALAAFVAGFQVGLDPEAMIGTLAAFHGAHRRFEVAGEAAGVTVVDDYAHHPTEIAATLAAARARFPGRRLVVLFQPHTYSRTEYLLDGFRSCFGAADLLLLLQTFAAREAPEAGLDARALGKALEGRDVQFVEDGAAAVEALARLLEPGDVCFTMGAGDVTTVGPRLLRRLATP
jgi:UDP-N-acetylmuramate--alanine ligase